MVCLIPEKGGVHIKNAVYDHGYGVKWKDVYVDKRERYRTSVTDFHEHEFYEINLILSGNVKVLLKAEANDDAVSKIVLAKPNTTHFISCKPDMLYSSLYLVFTEEFVTSYIPEYRQLLSVFGENGKIIELSNEQRERCKEIILKIQAETDTVRQKILIMYLLSVINDFSATDRSEHTPTPGFIIDALLYIDEHYAEKIVAKELAERLFIGRTTLMTEFKKYTGSTLNKYITHIRLKNALSLLRSGQTEGQVAEKCGFGDSSGLIRCFKRSYGVAPKQYLKQQHDK